MTRAAYAPDASRHQPLGPVEAERGAGGSAASAVAAGAPYFDAARALPVVAPALIVGTALVEGGVGGWSSTDVLLVASLTWLNWWLGTRPVWVAVGAIIIVANLFGELAPSFAVAAGLLGGLTALALNDSAASRADDLLSMGIDPESFTRYSARVET